MRQPLLWASLAYGAGLVGGCYVSGPIALWIVAVATFVLAAGFFAKSRPGLGFGLALGALALCGTFTMQLHSARPGGDPRIPQFANGKVVTVTAHVIREGNIRAAGSRDVRQRIDLETEEIDVGDRSVAIVAGLRLGVYAKGAEPDRHDDENVTSAPMPIFQYGDRLQFPAKLRTPRNFRNPGAFDYQGYLADLGIQVLGSARADQIQTLPGFAGNRVEAWRSRLHRSILAKIHLLWQPPEAALMDAAVLGEDAFLTPATRMDFQRSGTYHILVVSGMNVAILAFVVFWVMRCLRLGEALASLLTVLLSVAYAYLTQVGPPVWRAVLMVTVYLAVRLLHRERSMLNAWGAAALVVMAVSPTALLGASFQMTFLSVLIIAALGAPILERTSQPYLHGLRSLSSADFDRTLPPRVAQFRLDLRMVAGRLARFVPGESGPRVPLRLLGVLARAALSVFGVVFIAALMQIGLALPMAYYFHRATVIGLPANTVAVPLTGMLMPAAVAAVALSYVALPLAKIPAWIAAFALDSITGTVRWLGGFRIAEYRVPTPEAAIIVIGLVSLGLAMLLARRRRVLVVLGLVLLALSSFWISVRPSVPQIRPGVLEVTAIDVGEGDALLVVTPSGKTLLIDAGGPVGGEATNFDYGENVVSSYLWTRGIAHLDVAAVTHGHSDHIGGMRAILNNFRPHELWTGALPPTAAVLDLDQQAARLGIPVIRRKTGEQMEFGRMLIRVLAPLENWVPGKQPRNDDSLVMHCRFGNTAVLLEGDAEKAVERSMAFDFDLRADLLKVGHHGSQTATTPQLLAAVHPKWAVMSLGANNSFGFPRPEVLARLQSAGVHTFRTDVDGAVSFYLDGRTVTPQVACLR